MCVSRINQAEEEGISVVDVDGSYIYRKYQRLVESGENVTQPDHPGPPPSGWKVVNERSCTIDSTCHYRYNNYNIIKLTHQYIIILQV